MRKTLTLTISQEGRDKDKRFLLTEMSAMRAEKWATRLLIALMNSGLELSDDEAGAGMAGLASVVDRGGFRFAGSGISYHELEPLLDEMLGCIQIAEPKITRDLTEHDVEEVATLLFLRSEVIKLHTGFSLAERLSAFLRRRPSAEQSNIETSPEPSPLS
jgi:hypothetical protein